MMASTRVRGETSRNASFRISRNSRGDKSVSADPVPMNAGAALVAVVSKVVLELELICYDVHDSIWC